MRKIYDWAKLFAAGEFVLRRGRDYTCSQSSIVAQVRGAATFLGITPKRTVRITDAGDGIEVVVEKKERALCPR